MTMTKRIVAIAALIPFCACLCSCGPSRRKRVRMLKEEVPALIQFVEDNGEFLQLLIVGMERINEDNSKRAAESDSCVMISRLIINIEGGGVQTRADYDVSGVHSGACSEYTPFSSDEGDILLRAIQESSLDRVGVYIDLNRYYEISFTFAQVNSTSMLLIHPPMDIEEPVDYWLPFTFTIPVNDDWCILIADYT